MADDSQNNGSKRQPTQHPGWSADSLQFGSTQRRVLKDSVSAARQMSISRLTQEITAILQDEDIPEEQKSIEVKKIKRQITAITQYSGTLKDYAENITDSRKSFIPDHIIEYATRPGVTLEEIRDYATQAFMGHILSVSREARLATARELAEKFNRANQADNPLTRNVRQFGISPTRPNFVVPQSPTASAPPQTTPIYVEDQLS